jgi:hypothetical protein
MEGTGAALHDRRNGEIREAGFVGFRRRRNERLRIFEKFARKL